MISVSSGSAPSFRRCPQYGWNGPRCGSLVKYILRNASLDHPVQDIIIRIYTIGLDLIILLGTFEEEGFTRSRYLSLALDSIHGQ